jgi:hypothetical protein
MDSLAQIKKYAEEVAGQWNGDESGRQEEIAQIANDLLERVGEVEKLLSELEDF